MLMTLKESTLNMKRQFSELKNTIATLEKLVQQENNLRAISIYHETENAEHTLIASDDCKNETEINRITFQVLDENTKRNSTVYIYFRANNNTCFECANTFLKNYTLKAYETSKSFKHIRTNIITTDFEKTLFSLLKLHNITVSENKKASANKKASKKAQ